MGKNLITSNIVTGAAMPIKKGTLDFLQAAYNEQFVDLNKVLGAGVTDFVVNWGAKNSGGYNVGDTATISAGSVMQESSGIIFRSKAASFVIGLGHVIVGKFVTSYYANAAEADPVTFTNGATHNVHQIVEIEWSSDVSGSGFFDYVDLRRGIKTKLLNIGAWNMDTDDSVSITHGMDILDILSVKAVIYDDVVAFATPLDVVNTTDPSILEGGLNFIDNAQIYLKRKTGALFDDAAYSITPTIRGVVTRGYCIIQYII